MTKKQIILLHAALGVSEDLNNLNSLLIAHGFETHRFSFSGHGTNTADPAEFRIDFFARELDCYIKKNNLVSPAVFGHSLGGYVALYHKAHFEDSPLTSIFTYGTKFNWSESVVSKELPMLVPEFLESKYSDYAQSLKEKHGPKWKQLLLSTAHMMQHLEKLDGLTKVDLEDLSIPVVLIRGEQDRMVKIEETELTASWIRHGLVKMVANSKHDLSQANLSEIVKIIGEHIE